MAEVRDLSRLLHEVFGHREFRAHQQVVCEAAASGKDVLLVMPTGAGKSLCYQLPALARGGTCLVISPLIALMDDQASKLDALGLNVRRIHSGLSREDSRAACREYLNGELDFLFIAPERMRVPGFPEMLAKRKPALVAIDEAHCISQWGHDFRPDYRTLGQWLPALRPAPIVALTATATPAVQKDIAAQLQLEKPAIFITGFRRENLAVQVIELSKPQRAEFAAKLLKDAAARPAIVYAGSRKDAEELAQKLGKHFPCAAYHAGLTADTRERVQRAFLSGKLDAVVATVAFGMGVDKADVRTVVHVALPGSVEAYYQEIGRAGRDGRPSRTLLLHGFADRRLQEFFLERNYPPMGDVEKVAQVLPAEWTTVDAIHNKMRAKKDMMDRETLERAIEKLLASGVAMMDFEGNVRSCAQETTDPEGATWKRNYESQISAKRTQIDRMVAFAETTQCRMRALVEHFGDRIDTRASCGLCDVCNPAGDGSANAAHQPGADERRLLRLILRELAKRSTSTGKLFQELAATKDRKEFDALLDGLARAGLLSLVNDTFTNPEGNVITYRKASITHEGREPDDAALDTVWIRGTIEVKAAKSLRKASSGKAKATKADEAMDAAAQALFEKLRAWRTEEARPTKTPAFMILGDGVLRGIAVERPTTLAQLHEVSGMGPAKVDRFGASILAVCRSEGGHTAGRTNRPAKAEPEESKPRKSAAEIQAIRKEQRQREHRSAVQQAIRQEATVRQPREHASTMEFSAEQTALESRLRSWRMEEARTAGLPSFFVLSDTALRGVVELGPTSIDDLRAVRGMDHEKIARYGAAVVALCSA